MDDDAAWLLADDMPHATTEPATPAHSHPTIPVAAPPESVLTPGESRQMNPDDHSWLAIGEAFHPLPGRPLLMPADSPQPAAEVTGEPGDTVHAILPGVVHRSGHGLELRVSDGRVVGYRGDAVVQWTAGDGEPVAAGAVLGWIAPPPSGTGNTASSASMVIYLVQPDGMTVDPVRWLAGLADPRELDLAGGTDPFRTDLRLSGLWDGPADQHGVP